jgi:hypothetical protein
MRYFMDFSLKTHHNVSRNFRACFFVSLLLSLPTLFPASLEILATTCCLSFLFSPPRHRLKHHFFLSNYRCHDLWVVLSFSRIYMYIYIYIIVLLTVNNFRIATSLVILRLAAPFHHPWLGIDNTGFSLLCFVSLTILHVSSSPAHIAKKKLLNSCNLFLTTDFFGFSVEVEFLKILQDYAV